MSEEDDYNCDGMIRDHQFADCCGCFYKVIVSVYSSARQAMVKLPNGKWKCNECGFELTKDELLKVSK
jgi:hypothetical protein